MELDWPVDPDPSTSGVNTFILVNTLLIIDLTGAVTCQNDGGYQHHNRYSPNALSTLLLCNCSTSLFSGISLQSLCHHKVTTRAAEEIQSKQRLADKHMHTHMNTCMHHLHLIIGTSEDLPGGSLTHLYCSSYLCAPHLKVISFPFVILLFSF